jgi:7-cyano-7-deazaguanine synthase
VCQADYGGYYDCREEFVVSFAKSLGLGLSGDENELEIIAPLMWKTKAESIEYAMDLLGARFDRVMALTHTCYQGIKGGCGKCHACLIRDRGFNDLEIADPIWQFRNN